MYSQTLLWSFCLYAHHIAKDSIGVKYPGVPKRGSFLLRFIFLTVFPLVFFRCLPFFLHLLFSTNCDPFIAFSSPIIPRLWKVKLINFPTLFFISAMNQIFTLKNCKHPSLNFDHLLAKYDDTKELRAIGWQTTRNRETIVWC